MKCFITFIIFLLFAFNARCIDYYSGKTYLDAKTIKYKITEIPGSPTLSISLENVKNVLQGDPVDTTTNERYFAENSPIAGYSVEKLIQILDKVFSPSDVGKYFGNGCCLFYDMRINSKTGVISEIIFYLDYTPANKAVLSLPIEKIEELEKAMKKDLHFTVYEEFRNASFILASGRLL